MRASRVVVIVAILGNVLFAACTKENPLFCARVRDCPTTSAPICDDKRHECRGCAEDADCIALDRGTPTCVEGVCLGCGTHVDCTVASEPFCDPGGDKCRACSSGSECMAINASKPVCFPAGCAECGKDSDCTTAGKPICDMNKHSCRACGGNSECAAVDATKAVCAPSGSCLGCATDDDCKGLTATAICDRDTSSCRACKASSECAAIDGTKPVCTTTGLCAECNDDRDCKSPTNPICNVTSHSCRRCLDDSECAGEPGVCMAHLDGRCAVAAETILVQESAACDDKAPAAPGVAATKDAPACSMQAGLALLSAKRPLVVVRGAVSAGPSPVIATTETFVNSIVGQNNAVATTLGFVLTLRSGNAYVRGLKLGSAYEVALNATGGTLVLDKVTIDGALRGGILLDGAAFDIRNTTVTNSGLASEGVTTGGILIRTLATSGPKVLTDVTLTGNAPFNLSCIGPITGSGILAAGGADGDCGVTTCSTPGPTCGAH